MTRALRRVRWLAALLALAWLAMAVALFVLQRNLIYPARAPITVPQSEDLQLIRYPAGSIQGAALWVPPPDEATVVVYFHSNGSQLAWAARVARAYGQAGMGFLAVEYPGYGVLADLSPSEEALLNVAEGALTWLKRQGVGAERIVLQGRSLGTGVATAMAARGHGIRLALISPFRSIASVAAERYWFMPVNLLVQDRWDSAAKAPSVTIPTLIIHGDRDKVVPYEHGVAMAGLFPAGRLVTIQSAGHNDIFHVRDGLAKQVVKAFCARGFGAGASP